MPEKPAAKTCKDQCSQNQLWHGIISSETTALLFVAAFSAVCFLAFLGSRPLWAPDEIRVAGIGANMLLAKSWAVPLLNGHPFLEKPPLFFWAEAFFFHLWGFTPAAAKLPSALSALAGAAGLYLLSRASGFSRSASLFSALMLTVSVQYFITGRRCITDLMLTAFVIWTIYAAYRLLSGRNGRNEISWTLLCAVFLAGGLLTKGLVALAIPLAVLMPWHVISAVMKKETMFTRQAGLFALAVFISLVFCGIWLLFLYHDAGLDALYQVVWANNFGRFSGSHHGHAEPFWYYLKKLPEQALPWAVVLPVALPFNLRQILIYNDRRSLLMTCWLIFPFILLSAASGKRPIYLLPVHPAAAWMSGIFMDDCISKCFSWCSSGRTPKYLLVTLMMMAFAAAGAFMIFLAGQGRLTGWPTLLAAVTLLFSTAALRLVLRERFHDSLLLLLAGLGILFIGWYAFGSGIKWPYNSLKPFFQQVAQKKEYRVVLYRPDEEMRGGAVFYLGHVVPECYSESELEALALSSKHNRPLLLLGEKNDVTSLEDIRVVLERKLKKNIVAAVKMGCVSTP